MKIAMVALFLACAAIFGCGDDDTSGGECSFETAFDYETIDCYPVSTLGVSCDECEKDKRKFLQKHPGVNCFVERGIGLDKEKIRVTASHIESLDC